ncbi:MAG: carbamoyltransferase HypF [Sedimentisphaerales bacterium]|nr:carbamoyltransferase HypF [Sedimentisphaerales bacterium]
MIKRQKILITGRVQGVGFRPAVYRIATELGLTGFIYNDTSGVTIELQGQENKISLFVLKLNSEQYKPPLAHIETLKISEIELVENEKEFTIQTSDSNGVPVSHVTADTATCKDCLSEMRDKDDFRFGYPFINCTNCGPRYSIIKNIPYDRPNTTMSVFEMCDKCAAQYKDVTDRRFHAQPVACATCGPKVWLTDNTGRKIEKQTQLAIEQAAKMLLDGKIVAIKGLGGFHLAVDALNNNAVKRLRERKKRDHKPFALMTDSIDKIKQYAIVDDTAEKILQSPQSPIVLLPKNKANLIAQDAAEGTSTFGFMLCYTPLHFLLFAHGIDVLVMTSGNISDEPLICKKEYALEKLSDVADAFLMHDREIYRQVDDSVVHIIEDEPVLIRRSRGYVPTPIITKNNCEKDILAAGADLKNTFCFAKGNQLICSEHIGDLEDAEVYHHYINSIEHLAKLFKVQPEVVVCDLHPGYMSTQYAQMYHEQGVMGFQPMNTWPGWPCHKAMPHIIQVQHHWAHVASVLAENNISEPVIGLVCDGTGYGSDGKIWGCECLIASLENFERFGHLAYYELAGANKASKEAIRPVLSLLKKAYGDDFSLEKFDWLLNKIENDIVKKQIILEQIEKGVNCIETSSIGRVFDAVAAMLGIGNYNHFDAQLPIALEAIASENIEEQYNFSINLIDEIQIFDIGPAIQGIVSDLEQNIDKGIISAKFHNTLAQSLVEMAIQARKSTNINTAALSGGVFCNRYLLSKTIKLLKKNEFNVLFNRIVPSNDGGISIGQAAISSLVTRR